MIVSYSKDFIREAKKLNKQQREKLQVRIALFIENPLHPLLRNHALRGKYRDYRSIDVAGDIRALYLQEGNEVIFDTIGTRSQLYG